MKLKGFSVINGKICLLYTGCEDGESACPFGRIGTFSRSCILESLVCDGFRDCVDGTDEMNCTQPSKTFIANCLQK